jgi:hypothetical protein
LLVAYLNPGLQRHSLPDNTSFSRQTVNENIIYENIIVRVTLLNVEGKLTKKEACSNDQIKGKNYQKWENID